MVWFSGQQRHTHDLVTLQIYQNESATQQDFPEDIIRTPKLSAGQLFFCKVQTMGKKVWSKVRLNVQKPLNNQGEQATGGACDCSP